MSYYLVSAFLFVFGALIGSFLNVVILRGIAGQSVAAGRSACPHCKNILRWWELLPILSFVFLRGRCARCRKPISWQYPLVELATAVIFLSLGLPLLSGGITPLSVVSFLLSVVIAALLIVLFVTDLHTMLLPDLLIIILSVVVVIKVILSVFLVSNFQFLNILSGLVIGAGFLGLLWLLTKGRGIGLGDVKLMLPLGALFGGWGTVTLLFIAFFFGGLIGVILLSSRRASLKTAIPFGPFLAGAALLLLLFPGIADYFRSLVWPI